MSRFLTKIYFPALIVGVAAVQSLVPGAIQQRSKPSVEFSVSDSSVKVKDETVRNFDLRITNDTAYLNALGREKHINARDTMKAPDSLRLTNPFFYKYYVAIKDSLTHSETRDSLLKSGDTLSCVKLDSLYVIDSTETAKNSFAAWYASLTKKERKKYQFEQELPIKQHRMDSLLALKDSLKAIKDSIVQATPRVLQTFAFPDSLEYKRIVSWKHDRNFHKLDFIDIDTSYNFHYNDYPFIQKDVNAAFLGVSGSPALSFDFHKRDDGDDVSFYSGSASWSYSPSTLPMYNSKTPYTELAYHGTLFANKDKEEDNIHIFTTQNILPELNITLGYNRFGGGGMLDNETTRNKTFFAAANYTGKRYLAHVGYIYNMVDHDENGGITDNSLIRDTTIDAREINVVLTDANNLIKKNTVFLDQEYRIPFTFIDKLKERKILKAEQAYRDSVTATGDSLAIIKMNEYLAGKVAARESADTTYDESKEKVTTAFIGHSSEYSVYRKLYTDKIALGNATARHFFNDNFFYNPTQSADSMRVMRFENRAFIKLQPWANDAILSKLNVGIGNRIQTFYRQDKSFLYNTSNVTWNSTYLYAGAEGNVKQYFDWDVLGSYTLLGTESSDFFLKGNMGFNFYPFLRHHTSPVSLNLSLETSLKEPGYYEQHLFSNHYRWDNSFDKTSKTQLKATLDIPLWKMRLEGGYTLLKNNIYYDSTGTVRQNASVMSILSLSLTKNITLANVFHLDNRLLFQLTSDDKVVPLPMAALNLRYYVQLPVVKDVMYFQLGANVLYNTEWYSPGYNPVTSTFVNQREEKYGNCPYIDVFVNMQWKRACIFVKLENVGLGWPMDKADYFSANHYIRPQRALKLGMFWPFYTQPYKHKSLGGGSSSAGGGSASGSSGGSNSLGGMNSRMNTGRN